MRSESPLSSVTNNWYRVPAQLSANWFFTAAVFSLMMTAMGWLTEVLLGIGLIAGIVINAVTVYLAYQAFRKWKRTEQKEFASVSSVKSRELIHLLLAIHSSVLIWTGLISVLISHKYMLRVLQLLSVDVKSKLFFTFGYVALIGAMAAVAVTRPARIVTWYSKYVPYKDLEQKTSSNHTPLVVLLSILAILIVFVPHNPVLPAALSGFAISVGSLPFGMVSASILFDMLRTSNGENQPA